MRVLGTFFGEYTIIPGLNFRSSIGVDYADALGTSYQKRVPENVRGNLSIGTYAEEGSNVLTWNFVNTLTFSKTIAQKHSFSILAGSDLLKTYVSNISGYANNFLNDEIYMISNGAERVAEGSKVEYGLMSYIGRLTYAYDDRYLFAFNVRSDASANFAPDKRRGTFPSASAGWRISEEAFMSPLTFISNLKLRASWGILGNQNIPPFQYLSTYSTANTTYTLGTGTQAGQTAAFPVNLGNPDIQWERVEQKDIGMDVDLMAGRLSLVLDYYIKDNNDMLITEPRPSYFPITTVTTNGASMRNQGFEFTVAYRKQSGSFQWDANVNLTTLKNEVTGLGDLGLPIIRDLTGGVTYNNAATRTEIGQPIGYFWGLQTDGLFQNDAEVAAANGSHGSVKPGDRRYVDQNGDGKIDDKDRINLGDGLPNLLLGAGFNASYKNFDFSLLLSGQFGSQIANANRRRLYDLVQQQGAGLVNVSSDMKNHWKGEGTSTTIPRVTLDTPSNNILFSDFYIEDGDFVRLRNIQLGYTIPNIPFLEKLRIYISAQNLLTFTSYTGFDPEIGSRNQDQLVTGYDNTRYPSAKSIMGGINLQF
jgi:TonB-linked SusC/RagA family outer membrane protein